MRTVARMLLPSTRQPMICARFSVLSLFILTILLERPDGKVTRPRAEEFWIFG
jgi:hypothetical protein